MSGTLLLLPIAVPAAAGLLALLPSGKASRFPGWLAVGSGAIHLGLAFFLFPADLALTLPWLGFGIEAALRLTRLGAFVLLAVSAFAFLVSLYSVLFIAAGSAQRWFFAWLLLSVSAASGAVLADNLVLLLLFWEGLLPAMFALIALGANRPYATAIKAAVIVGVSDLCLMLGAMFTWRLAGTLSMSAVRLPLDGLAGPAFLLLMAGAIGKAGAVPFHSWLPDAARDAPLPFMAVLPASIEKLLGIYFLARLSLELFTLTPGSWVSTVLMVVGAATILLAVAMALVQQDFKRLLSYHAISQVGYMSLGIGTALPVGIAGGLFHMLNNALYKSCLFLTAGSVERQAGGTDLAALGGLGRRMPVTAGCFIVSALSISGVPPFNGFFSKELVYEGALERGWLYYAAALLGSFLTAASFLKAGHSAFFGPPAEERREVKEAPWPMLLPMIVLSALCVLFGVANSLPLGGLIAPAMGPAITGGRSFAGFPPSMVLLALTALVLLAAVLNHWYGVRKTGRAVKAVDHIHYAPGLSQVYAVAERGHLDPYTIGRWVVKGLAAALWGIDRGVDWVYETLTVKSGLGLAAVLRRAHNGRFRRYVLWSLAGALAVAVSVIALFGRLR